MFSPLLTVYAINRELILSAQALPYLRKRFTCFGASAQLWCLRQTYESCAFPTR